MKRYIEEYLKDKELAWSESTLRSERHRLNAVADALNGSPQSLWKAVQELGPYSRLTTWTRAVSFYDYLIDTGRVQAPNPYKVFRKKNAKQFKNVYTRRTPDVSFEEAAARIGKIEDASLRAQARQLLLTGMRVSESGRLDPEHGEVVGKGAKRRRVVLPEGVSPTCGASYARLLQALKRVGLKPHDLRKIFATELVKRGADVFELMAAMGWSDLNTAQSYVRVDKASLESKIKQIQSEVKGWNLAST